MSAPKHEQVTEPNAFELSHSEPQPGLIAEFWEFLCENKKFWMIPLIGALLVLGFLIAMGGTVAAPFIYSIG